MTFDLLFVLSICALLLLALGVIGLLSACDGFRREVERERARRFYETERAGWEP